MQAFNAGKEILDRAVEAKRSLTAEEKLSYDRADAAITRLDLERNALLSNESVQYANAKV